MLHSMHFPSIAMGVVFLGFGISRSLSADPPGEPLPTGTDSNLIGYSTPELTPTPGRAVKTSGFSKPVIFP